MSEAGERGEEGEKDERENASERIESETGAKQRLLDGRGV